MNERLALGEPPRGCSEERNQITIFPPKKGVHLRPPIPVLIGNEPLFGILKLPRTLKSLGLLDNCLTAWQSHKARPEAVVFIDARSFEPEHLCRRSSGRVVFLFLSHQFLAHPLKRPRS